MGALTPRAPRDNLGGVIRRPLTSRLLPLVALLVFLAVAAPLDVAAQTLRWDMPNEYPGAAGQVAVDEWTTRIGLAGKDILDRYRARLASAPAGGTK